MLLFSSNMHHVCDEVLATDAETYQVSCSQVGGSRHFDEYRHDKTYWIWRWLGHFRRNSMVRAFWVDFPRIPVVAASRGTNPRA